METQTNVGVANFESKAHKASAYLAAAVAINQVVGSAQIDMVVSLLNMAMSCLTEDDYAYDTVKEMLDEAEECKRKSYEVTGKIFDEMILNASERDFNDINVALQKTHEEKAQQEYVRNVMSAIEMLLEDDETLEMDDESLG